MDFDNYLLNLIRTTIPDVLKARSKDLTLNASNKFDQTRHQDILEKLDIQK